MKTGKVRTQFAAIIGTIAVVLVSMVNLGGAAAWAVDPVPPSDADQTDGQAVEPLEFVRVIVPDDYVDAGSAGDAQVRLTQVAGVLAAHQQGDEDNLAEGYIEAFSALVEAQGNGATFAITGAEEVQAGQLEAQYRTLTNEMWSPWETVEHPDVVQEAPLEVPKGDAFEVILTFPEAEPADLPALTVAVDGTPAVPVNALTEVEGVAADEEADGSEVGSEEPTSSEEEGNGEDGEVDEDELTSEEPTEENPVEEEQVVEENPEEGGAETDDETVEATEEESAEGRISDAETVVEEQVQAAPMMAQAQALLATPSNAELIARWNPGFIISDATLYTSSRMSEAQIRSFINEKNANCVSQGGRTCLRHMAAPATSITTAQANPAHGCKPLRLTAASSDPAKAIKAVGDACGINPEVLLVFIQKESSGIFQPLERARWDKMMGMGCPDNQPCNPRYSGFINQLYYSADALTSYRYRNFPFNNSVKNGTLAAVNNSSSVGPACGTQTFRIHNQATASLYTYNPAVPTKAAMQAYPGTTGNRCDSYGQRNTYMYMMQWFPNSMRDHPGPTGNANVQRLAGADRYQTNIAVNKASNNAGKPVFVVSGTGFADALSVGPAVSMTGGYLVLTRPGQVPSESLNYIKAQNPGRIYVIGGTDAVAANVEHSLRAATGVTPVRIGGEDRYQTSSLILRTFFSDQSVPRVFVASGGRYADGLSAAAAGGALKAPVLLVPGTSSRAPSSDATSFLRSKFTRTVAVVGGTSVVSEAMAQKVRSALPGSTVTRLSGIDRFSTNLAVNRYIDSSGGSTKTGIWIATGWNFADALSAAVPAGQPSQRLVLSRTNCVPRTAVTDWISNPSSGVSTVRLVGGPSVLSSDVFHLNVCGS